MKEALLKLKGNEKLKVNFDVIVNKTQLDDENDMIIIDVIENNIKFEHLIVMKGEIFPLPKTKDLLNIKELYIDYDENFFLLRVFINAEIKSNDNNIPDNFKEIISFSKKNVLGSFKKSIGFDKDIISRIFKIDLIEEKYCNILCLEDLNIYKIPQQIISSPLKDEFILLCNYYIEDNNKIKLNNLSFVKKLTEKKVFNSYKKEIFGLKLILFKVVDINENHYILIDNSKILYQMEKNQTVKALELCQLLLLHNFNILENNHTILKDIFLEKNSIIHISQQDIYFDKNIYINNLTVINMNFLDYQEKNLYNKIIIEEILEQEIKNKELYYVIYFYNDFDYYKISIDLKKASSDDKKRFYIFLYKGLLNAINAFINYNSENSYFIEYYFMSIDTPIKEINTQINIEINNKKYDLKYLDTFQSDNRLRINALNIPYQEIESFDKKNLKTKDGKKINSIQICEIFFNKESIIYGIFDINEFEEKLKKKKIDNSEFDKYYNFFGDIPSMISDLKTDCEQLKKICIEKYNKSNINISEEEIISNFDNNLTHSQYKTRLGLLVYYYINKCECKKDIKYLKTLFFTILNNIMSTNITFSQSLRIINLFIRKKFKNISSLDELIFFSELSTYFLARELNKQEITNLNEFSRYFPAYLQLESFIMFNYYKGEMSYTFSLELLFIMKYLLLSNYEDFAFTTKENSDEFAYNTEIENITVINENNLFTLFSNNYNNIFQIKDIEESKNLAIPISFEFRHEKNAHQARNNKNPNILSPKLYYKDGKIERIEKTIKLDNGQIITKGESGTLIENYLSANRNIILELKIMPIFGELLDYRYFIEKDFSKLLKKMEEIKNNSKTYKNSIKDSKCEIYDNIESFEKLKKIKDEERTKKWTAKLSKEGIVKLGDVHYTKKDFEKYIITSFNKK